MSELLFSTEETEKARDAVFEAGAWQIVKDLGPWVQFASGRWANNKLLMDSLVSDDQPAEIQDAILNPLAKVVELSKADVLWGVVTGGQQYAVKLGERLDLPVVKLKKAENKPGFKTYHFVSDEDKELANHAQRLAGFEDAGTEMTSLYGALRLSPQLRRMARATVAIGMGWRRGLLRDEKPLPIQVYPLVDEHIPNMISRQKRFFKLHGDRAVWVERK